MKNYTQFAAEFMQWKLADKVGLTETSYTSEPSEEWATRVQDGLNRSKIFEITDNMKILLSLTNTPNKNDFIHLPFPIIFIDVDFSKEFLKDVGIETPYPKITGIIVGERAIIREQKEKVLDTKYAGRCLTFEILVKELYKGKLTDCFKSFSSNFDLIPEEKDNFVYKTPYLDNKTKRFLQGFVLNVLNTLYDPEVEYVMTETDEKRNIKRMKEGKQPIPGRLIIKTKGKLKIYLDKIKTAGITHYNHRFWVRGHYRTLRNERYGENVGKRIWIVPYIKGQGLLINRQYLMESKYD